MDTYKGVLLFGEVDQCKLAPITMELLGIGRKLANELGQELGILLIGNKIGELAQEAIACGADKVYIADAPSFEHYSPDIYVFIANNLCRKALPYILLLGQTDIGRDLAPRLVSRLQGGLAMDCVELAIEPQNKLLVATRPVFGGNALATVISRVARLQMATIRARTMKPAERDASRQGQIIPLETNIDPSIIKVKIIERKEEKAEGVKLEDAETVVAGGRGIGSAQNFGIIRELAQVLGGAIGATRVACEEGWVPATYQIGQTGKIVSPKLYFAIGISGAMQHIAGCTGAKCIVAINRDPEANIFKVAQYGIVGNYEEVLPVLISKLKELQV